MPAVNSSEGLVKHCGGKAVSWKHLAVDRVQDGNPKRVNTQHGWILDLSDGSKRVAERTQENHRILVAR